MRSLGLLICGASIATAFNLAPAVRVGVAKVRSLRVEKMCKGETRKSCNSVSMSATSGDGEPVTRRGAIAGVATAAAAAIAAASSTASFPEEASAIGPIKMDLTEPTYQSVVCPPKTQVPGEKAGAGLKPVCVQVTCTAENPTSKDVKDAAVFGFVTDEDKTSVVANNPDGASDAGQFAIIPTIPVGKSRVNFQFVAAIPPKEDFDTKLLKFSSLKAISYPGGQRYGAITECEMNPLAEGCDFD